MSCMFDNAQKEIIVKLNIWKKKLFILSKSDELREETRVADPDPDPYWIRIQSGQWIRIRIRNPDPDQGEQKWPTSV